MDGWMRADGWMDEGRLYTVGASFFLDLASIGIIIL